MRLDHYSKIGNNNIQLASISYSLISTVLLTSILAYYLKRDLKIDISNIKILNLRKKQRRFDRIKASNEDENRLKQTKLDLEPKIFVGWKKL